MLRRVARPHHHAPEVVANRDLLAVDDAPDAVWQGVQRLAEAAEAGAVAVHRVLAPAGGAIEAHAVLRSLAAGVGGEHPAHQVLKPGNPQAAVELARDPAGHADVVGVHVGDEHPGHPLAVQRLGEDVAPGGGRGGVLHAGVDNGPAIAILERPDVDVGQRTAQRHAHPFHAWRNVHRAAQGGPLREGIDQPGPGRIGVLETVPHAQRSLPQETLSRRGGAMPRPIVAKP